MRKLGPRPALNLLAAPQLAVSRPNFPPIASLITAAVVAVGLSACGAAKQSMAAGKSTSAASPTTATLPGTDKPPVTIGDQNYTEQFVLGELYKQALAAQGYTALINRNIGVTQLQALQTGRLDMYPEYLGTWNTSVAGDQRQFTTVREAYQAGQAYAQARGLQLLGRTPFSDVDAIAVNDSYAQQNMLHTIADLTKVAPTLTLGAPPQFKASPTGLPLIEQVYGVLPAAFKALDVGEQYRALDQGSVQAADVNTTDGELLSGQYTLLADPKRAFGWGNVVPVVPSKVLATEGPAFAVTINTVSALLTTATMRQLNAAVDIYHQDPAAVAKQFLQAHGLVPPG
jgi:osmoprotectant transport system substrate-binding protein